MPRKKLPPGEGKTYVNVGLDPDDVALMQDVMAVYRCSQSAALRMLIRAGADSTPHNPPRRRKPQVRRDK